MALRSDFLNAMSLAASTVTIVTTDGVAGRAGLTVSAMASVSADMARPALLVCIHHKSAAGKVLRRNGTFCVNLLASDQSALSDAFGGRGGGDKFAAADWTTGTTGAPRLSGALATFDCAVTDSQLVGTHFVIFGAVESAVADLARMPLLYGRRSYQQLAA
ncbi:MAG: flavin reductase family protein [Alphaproteobacteria bacterium]|jgi:flavin reductase|nr:flavin reductase family protein [Alphaproteobacteria bacterium]